MLTPGQDHDLTCAQPLLENADPRALIGDKAYDADSLIGTLNQRAILPVIPPKANRKVKRDCDFALYRERNPSLLSPTLPSHFEVEVVSDLRPEGSVHARQGAPDLTVGARGRS